MINIQDFQQKVQLAEQTGGYVALNKQGDPVVKGTGFFGKIASWFRNAETAARENAHVMQSFVATLAQKYGNEFTAGLSQIPDRPLSSRQIRDLTSAGEKKLEENHKKQVTMANECKVSEFTNKTATLSNLFSEIAKQKGFNIPLDDFRLDHQLFRNLEDAIKMAGNLNTHVVSTKEAHEIAKREIGEFIDTLMKNPTKMANESTTINLTNKAALSQSFSEIAQQKGFDIPMDDLNLKSLFDKIRDGIKGAGKFETHVVSAEETKEIANQEIAKFIDQKKALLQHVDTLCQAEGPEKKMMKELALNNDTTAWQLDKVKENYQQAATLLQTLAKGDIKDSIKLINDLGRSMLKGAEKQKEGGVFNAYELTVLAGLDFANRTQDLQPDSIYQQLNSPLAKDFRGALLNCWMEVDTEDGDEAMLMGNLNDITVHLTRIIGESCGIQDADIKAQEELTSFNKLSDVPREISDTLSKVLGFVLPGNIDKIEQQELQGEINDIKNKEWQDGIMLLGENNQKPSVQTVLLNFGYDFKSVAGDGNCFYHSIGCTTQDDAEQTREKLHNAVGDFLETVPEDKKFFYDDLQERYDNKQILNPDKKTTDEVYGNIAECPVVAKSYNRPVVVFAREQPGHDEINVRFRPQVYSPDGNVRELAWGEKLPNEAIVLVHSGGLHWDGATPRKD
ncbi:hypothetical protein CCP4SC76_2970004 [Gammaproteobacteria bacterium]